MQALELIIKKRNGLALTKDEISFLVNRYTEGKISDYQMSALLMAVYFQGMNLQETVDLTSSMAHSGQIISLKEIDGIVVDKHSTGGVGDGVSLVLAPLVAAAGVPVLMLCGRCLGHTGGTIDKLESISGFCTNLSARAAIAQVKKIGVAIMAQTKELAPADGKLYALRDVTGTVENNSLICASILSKKIAAGVKRLVLDVKCGSGAFMTDFASAKKLAKLLIKVGKMNQLQIRAVITNMEQPLGLAIGNSLEIEQAIEILKGRGPRDFKELTLELGAEMLVLGKKAKNLREGKEVLSRLLESGQALSTFYTLMKAQGGSLGKLPQASYKKLLYASHTGYVSAVNAREIGMIATLLGAGRLQKSACVDPAAGVLLRKKIGDRVKKGEVLGEFYYSGNRDVKTLGERFKKAFSVQAKPARERKLILWRG